MKPSPLCSKKLKKDIILVVNKVDVTGELPAEFYEFYGLGLGEPFAVSSTTVLAQAICLTKSSQGYHGIRRRTKRRASSRWRSSASQIARKVIACQPHFRGAAGHRFGCAGHHKRTPSTAPLKMSRDKYVFIDTAGLRRKRGVTESIERYSCCGPIWPLTGPTSALCSLTPLTE
jgi:GTP-binding protein